MMVKNEIVIKDTHRGLWYEDGALIKVVEAGRYRIPKTRKIGWLFGRRQPRVEVALVDMRERDLTIKGQEILTMDKVAIRVSILVQFQVMNPRAAMHLVENYQDRLYSDVQLSLRRLLAMMTLEDILAQRNRLSEELLIDVRSTSRSYGVRVLRAAVKDLIFPGALRKTIDQVMTAERLSRAQLIEARTEAEKHRIQAAAAAEASRIEIEAVAEARRRAALIEAEVKRIQTASETAGLQEREKAATAYTQHPALLRLMELETMRELSRDGNTRIYGEIEKKPAIAQKM
jgi:regulator of protease activity HflC (stomatin/prohibitin superfamily)